MPSHDEKSTAADEKSTAAIDRQAGDHLRVQQLGLRVTRGPDKGQVHLTAKESILIGTHPSNDFVLTDRTVSRFHCELSLCKGEATVRDLGSRNGTDVGGVRIEVAYLRPGVVLSLGETAIKIERARGSSQIALFPGERFGLLVGRSETMRATFALLERAAQSSATVLLQGETGTGKDLSAESIHLGGERRDGAFVVVDCGAIPGSLLEAELFGYEKGAFTGADRSHEGVFEAADGGTLFLDEIGELPIDLQPKILRALEKRKVQRLGSSQEIPVDVRLIAASNRDLRKEVNAGRFRPDLYYRIAVVPISVPPLREHLEDVPLLVEEILTQLAASGPIVEELRGAAFLNVLQQHAWPGNVRELRNHVERCLALEREVELEEDAIRAGERPVPPIDVRKPYAITRERWIAHFERRFLEELLREHRGNASAAMRAAGIPRAQFYRMLKRAGIPGSRSRKAAK